MGGNTFMGYKLFACDLDYTLLHSDRTLSPRTISAIDALRNIGVLFVLCTGRMPRGTLPFYRALGLHTPLICFGGAQVFDAQMREIYNRPLESCDTRALLEFAHERDLYAHVYLHDTFCYEHANIYADQYAAHIGFSGIEIPDLHKQQTLCTPKFALLNEPERIPTLQEEIRAAFPHLHITRSMKNAVEVTHPESTKGTALAFLTEYLGLHASQTIAAGDTLIDLSMLRYAGLSIAPANALPEILSIADRICASNDEDGIASFIEENLLGDYQL